jgi:hypothetical protein
VWPSKAIFSILIFLNLSKGMLMSLLMCSNIICSITWFKRWKHVEIITKENHDIILFQHLFLTHEISQIMSIKGDGPLRYLKGRRFFFNKHGTWHMYMYDVHTYYHTCLYNKPPFIITPLLTTFVCDTNILWFKDV